MVKEEVFFKYFFLGKKTMATLNYGPLSEKVPMLLLIRYRLIGSLVILSLELISDFVLTVLAPIEGPSPIKDPRRVGLIVI